MKKEEAVKLFKEKGGVLYVNNSFGNYFLTPDYDSLLKLLSVPKPVICEVVLKNQPLCLFFDIDIGRNFNDDIGENNDTWRINDNIICRGEKAIEHLTNRLKEVLSEYNWKIFALKSHKKCDSNLRITKWSYHLIVRMISKEGKEIVFEDTDKLLIFLDHFFGNLPNEVYDRNCLKSGGFVFRTIYSNKWQKKAPIPFRPLQKTDDCGFTISDNDKKYFLRYFETSNYEFFPCDQLKIVNKNHKSETTSVTQPKMQKKSACGDSNSTTSTPQYSLNNCPYAIHLATSLINLFAKDNKMNINSLMYIRKCSQPIDIVCIAYDGECFMKKIKHTSNHCYIQITSKMITAKCHKVGCKPQYQWPTDSFLTAKQFDLLCGKLDITEIISDYITVVDAGNPILTYHNKAYVGEVSCKVIEKYEKFKRGMQFFDGKQHAMIKGKDSIEVEEYRESEACRISTLFENCSFVNSNVIIMHEKENRDCAKRRKSVDSELDDDWLEELVNSYFEKFSDSPFLEVKEELFNWAKMKNHDSLGVLVGKLLLKSGVYYSAPDFLKWDGMKWIIIKDDIRKRGLILKTVVELFRILYKCCEAYTNEKSLLKELISIRKQQYASNFLFNLTTSACDILFKENIMSLLDTNWDFIPFKNGIYDIKKTELLPLGPHTFNTFNLHYDFATGAIDAMKLILESIFPDDAERNYAIQICASALDDTIPNDKIYFFIGDGSNGKSVFTKLIKKAFGFMAFKLPQNFFTSEPKESSAPTPQIERLSLSRLAMISEPPTSNGFKSHLIKIFCGGEDVNSRQLYGSGINEYDMRTQFIVCANDMPEFSVNDAATWRRVEMLLFRTKFVENPTKSHERKLDVTLQERIKNDPNLHQAFMSMILNEKERMGVNYPEVPLAMKEYKQRGMYTGMENSCWLEENTTNEINAFVSRKEIYAFKNGIDVGSVEHSSANYRKFSGHLTRYITTLNSRLPSGSDKMVEDGSFTIEGTKKRAIKNLKLKSDAFPSPDF